MRKILRPKAIWFEKYLQRFCSFAIRLLECLLEIDFFSGKIENNFTANGLKTFFAMNENSLRSLVCTVLITTRIQPTVPLTLPGWRNAMPSLSLPLYKSTENIWHRLKRTKKTSSNFSVLRESVFVFKGNNAFKVLSDGMHSRLIISTSYSCIHVPRLHPIQFICRDKEKMKIKWNTKNTCVRTLSRLSSLSLTQWSLECVGCEKDRVSFENHFLSVKCFRFEFFFFVVSHALVCARSLFLLLAQIITFFLSSPHRR